MANETRRGIEEGQGRLSDRSRAAQYLTWATGNHGKETLFGRQFAQTRDKHHSSLTSDAALVLGEIFGEPVQGQRKPSGRTFLGRLGAYCDARANGTLILPIPPEAAEIVERASDFLSEDRVDVGDPGKLASLLLTQLAETAHTNHAATTTAEQTQRQALHDLGLNGILEMQIRVRDGDRPEHADAVDSIVTHVRSAVIEEISVLADLVATENAARDTVNQIKVLCEVSEARGDLLAFEPESGRNMLPAVDGRPARSVPLDFINTSDLDFPIPEEIDSLPRLARAKLLQGFIMKMTREHNPEGTLSDEFTGNLLRQIDESIASGKPLTFSLYLALEKFANPFDTKNSHIDIGEVGIAQEMAQFLETVHHITGVPAEIIIMNESPATERFSHASGEIYKSELERVFETLGISDQVKIQPFSRDLYVDYLSSLDPNNLARIGLDNPPREQLVDTVADIENYIVGLYRGIVEQKITAADGRLIFDKKFALSTALPIPLIDAIHTNIATNMSAVRQEAGVAIKVGIKSNLDPSVLFPHMSESLWAMILKKADVPADLQKIVEAGRSHAIEQANIHGLSFVALKRIRNVVEDLFGFSVGQYVRQQMDGAAAPEPVIALSIVSAPQDKLSWLLGRSKQTGIYIDGNEVPEAKYPQHGAGVLLNGRVVSLPWETVLNHPEEFHPIKVTVGGIEVNGYSRDARAAMIDLDGTVKDSGEPVPQKVWETIYNTLRQGKAFGFATGRSQASIERLILQPFREYLQGREPVDENLFVVSGNQGATFNTGIFSVNNVYQIPLFDNGGDNAEQFMRVVADSTRLPILSRFAQRYLSNRGADYQEVLAANLDGFAFYFNPGDAFDKSQEEAGLGGLPIMEFAKLIQDELTSSGIDLRVEAKNDGGFDLVNTKAGKHVALATFINYASEVMQRELHETDIITVGDSPEGNDKGLVGGRRMGASEVTKSGPETVATYLDLMLNN